MRLINKYKLILRNAWHVPIDKNLFLLFQDKMEEMQQHNMSWIEVQFLKKAVDILCECRRTLMYTYVFAYYLRKNNQSEIFEVR